MCTAIATKGEQYRPEGKMPVRAVAEDHVRSAFYKKYIDGEADKTSSADAQKAAFKRTLKKLLGEKRTGAATRCLVCWRRGELPSWGLFHLRLASSPVSASA
jgi:hypothetical protein